MTKSMTEKVHALLTVLETKGPEELFRREGITGWRGNAMHCPVANYLRKAGIPIDYVSVARVMWGFENITLTEEEFPRVKQFIKDFDHGRIVFDSGEYPGLVA